MFGLDFLAQKAVGGEQRRESRQTATGSVRIGGTDYDLTDWSSSGFQATGPKGKFAKGDRMEIEFTVDIGDETYFFECGCFVVRVEPDNKSFAGVFVDMDPSDRQAVVQYFEDR